MKMFVFTHVSSDDLEEILKNCDEITRKVAYEEAKRNLVDTMQKAIVEFADACDTEEKFEMFSKKFGEFMETASKTLGI